MKKMFAWLDARTYQRRTIIWCKFMYLRAFIKNGFRSKTVLFYPDKPRVWHLLYSVCHVLGYYMTNDPRAKFDLAVAFEDTTVRTSDGTIAKLVARYHVLNSRCGDISKERVDKIFLETFGYGLPIDPRTYQGTYIKKYNSNAQHYGEILNKPSEPEKGFVYQKLVDNQTDKDSVTDIRTFVFGDDIVFTFYRKRSIHDRFNDDTVRATLVETDDAFTKEEQANIIRFSKAFGTDFAEFDILRDNKDGKIYIVDVNITTSGPVPGIHISKKNYDVFLTRLSQAFQKMAEKNSLTSSTHTPKV
jgi:hypothetical protein